MGIIAKKAVKERLPEKLLSCYYSLRYKQLLQYNQRDNLTFEQAEQRISRQYFKRFGKQLDWKQPLTYTEIMNVVKLYGGNQLKSTLTDKFSVRDWIKNKIGEKYLISLIGTYANFDEIDFSNLPVRFVIKYNHDCGSVFLCKNKNGISKNFWNDLKKRYDFYGKRNLAYVGFEMHYKFITPKIIIEKLIGEGNTEIEDYKFVCFNGKPYYCWVITNRFTNQKLNVYDLDWNLQPFRINYRNSLQVIEKPARFELMKQIATTLCQGFDHVRVDLYSVHEKVYFGEMTFTTASGLATITPSEFDYKLGELWEFDNDSIQEKRNKLKDIKLKDYTYYIDG